MKAEGLHFTLPIKLQAILHSFKWTLGCCCWLMTMVMYSLRITTTTAFLCSLKEVPQSWPLVQQGEMVVETVSSTTQVPLLYEGMWYILQLDTTLGLLYYYCSIQLKSIWSRFSPTHTLLWINRARFVYVWRKYPRNERSINLLIEDCFMYMSYMGLFYSYYRSSCFIYMWPPVGSLCTLLVYFAVHIWSTHLKKFDSL